MLKEMKSGINVTNEELESSDPDRKTPHSDKGRKTPS